MLLAPLLAAALVLSPKDTKVTFALDATVHTVHGTVPLTSGTIQFDPGTGHASGEVVLDLARAQTGNKGRDEDMHAKVLESARYPHAIFRPHQVQGTLRPSGTSEVVLKGTLLFHGAEHPVEIPAKVTLSGNRATADGHLTIPYVAWGLRDPSKFVLRVGKTVEVHLQAVGDLR
ncbi:MAG TPA: YceI family protein [Candidatus Polarisedimenticolaceae bacterium]|nr:YceI family protein [Candidatus Polarisedimenticolaceae bacterium]